MAASNEEAGNPVTNLKIMKPLIMNFCNGPAKAGKSRRTNPGATGPSNCSMTDEQLIEALQSGRPDALGVLYQRYSSFLRTCILHIIHDEAEADDLLQEAFTEIYSHAKDFSLTKGKLIGWMVTIVRRRAIDRLRKREAYSRAKERFQQELENTTNLWSHRNAFKEIILADLRLYLDTAINDLPREQQKSIKLAFYRGLSQREISALTRTPLGTVKTRLELGLKKMAAAFAESKAKIW